MVSGFSYFLWVVSGDEKANPEKHPRRAKIWWFDAHPRWSWRWISSALGWWSFFSVVPKESEITPETFPYIYIYYTLFFFEDQQLKSLRKQRFIHPKPLEGPWGFLKWNLCTWQVVVTFLGWWSDPLNGQVSSNSGDEKVTNWITWCRLLCYFVFVLVFVVFLNMSGGRLIAFA